jgi:serine/threonine protein phosphatase 1
MLAQLKAWLAPKARQRLSFTAWPAAIYAIGDVHGCLDELLALERRITADASRFAGGKWLIMLGDYADRGPRSAAVLDHLIGPPPPDFERICLAGNHDVMLLDALENPAELERWFSLGGRETLQSYGIEPTPFLALDLAARRAVLAAQVPAAHLEFLRELPACLAGPEVIFVHAGIRRGVALARQTDEDLLWMRPKPADDAAFPGPPLVIHGHTPSKAPLVLPHRLGVDTGAFASGVLTAVRLLPDGSRNFLQNVDA